MSHYGSEAKAEPNPRRWKRLAAILALVITLIGLALGLGLGIGLRSGGEEEEVPRRREKWKPEVGASWQIILRYSLDLTEDSDLTPDVDVYDLDLYSNDAAVFSELRRRGKRVICYFSAGSYEHYRPDSGEFEEDDMGEELDGWPGERWLNISSPGIRDIMAKRIKLAAEKGCDAIDPDNVDGYKNQNGLNLTEEDSTSFIKFLSDEAANHKLAIGLKNAGEIIPSVLRFVDFCVNEQCAQYNECDTFADFVEDGKPVFQIEYARGSPDQVEASARKESCEGEGSHKFSTVLKAMELDGWVQYCDGKSYDTAVDG